MIQTNLMSALGSGPQLVRFTLDYSDLTTAGTSQTTTLSSALLSKGSIVLGVRIKHATAFSGGTINAMTVSVGCSAGAVNTYATAFDIYQAVSNTTFQVSENFNASTYAADTLTATFTSTAGNLNTATAGKVHIDVYVWSITTPDTYL